MILADIFVHFYMKILLNYIERMDLNISAGEII